MRLVRRYQRNREPKMLVQTVHNRGITVTVQDDSALVMLQTPASLEVDAIMYQLVMTRPEGYRLAKRLLGALMLGAGSHGRQETDAEAKAGGILLDITEWFDAYDQRVEPVDGE